MSRSSSVKYESWAKLRRFTSSLSLSILGLSRLLLRAHIEPFRRDKDTFFGRSLCSKCALYPDMSNEGRFSVSLSLVLQEASKRHSIIWSVLRTQSLEFCCDLLCVSEILGRAWFERRKSHSRSGCGYRGCCSVTEAKTDIYYRSEHH